MNPLIEYLLTGLGFLFAISYGYGQWKQGRNQDQLDNDSIYKGRIDALELKIKLQGDDIERLTEQVKKLRIDNEEANRKLLEAMSILQGRDPQLTEFIKSGEKYMDDGHEFMTYTKLLLIRLDKFLNKESF
jgi:hypothetical protein